MENITFCYGYDSDDKQRNRALSQLEDMIIGELGGTFVFGGYLTRSMRDHDITVYEIPEIVTLTVFSGENYRIDIPGTNEITDDDHIVITFTGFDYGSENFKRVYNKLEGLTKVMEAEGQ